MLTTSRMAAAGLSTGLLLLAACVDGTGRDAEYGLVVVPDLDGLDGQVVMADGVIDPDRELVPGAPITMAFTPDSVSVDAGCNTMSGPASVDDYELVVGELTSTRRACDEARDEQDQWLMSFLTSRPRFERVDDDLYLSRDDTVIHLVPAD